MKYIERIAYCILMVAVLLAFSYPDIARYLGALGSAGLAITHFSERYEGKNVRLKRLMRIRYLIGFIFIGASYLMFRTGNYWIVAYLTATVLELYTLYIITREENKKQ
ncbi:MAG: hypothetical protein KBT20_03270 [Bacteroidales bacterium]|nr:hypothetical protein [Candidatus Liminaster caballi]